MQVVFNKYYVDMNVCIWKNGNEGFRKDRTLHPSNGDSNCVCERWVVSVVATVELKVGEVYASLHLSDVVICSRSSLLDNVSLGHKNSCSSVMDVALLHLPTND